MQLLNSVIGLCTIVSKGGGPQLLSGDVFYMLRIAPYAMLVCLFCASLFISVILADDSPAKLDLRRKLALWP